MGPLSAPVAKLVGLKMFFFFFFYQKMFFLGHFFMSLQGCIWPIACIEMGPLSISHYNENWPGPIHEWGIYFEQFRLLIDGSTMDLKYLMGAQRHCIREPKYNTAFRSPSITMPVLEKENIPQKGITLSFH